MTMLNPLTESVVLYQGDDQEQINNLADLAREARAREEKNSTRTLGDVSEWRALAEQHDAFVEEAKERAITVVVRALGRKTWRSLVSDHPPREDHKGDAHVGVNEETFADALVPLSVASPVFDSDSKCDDFLDGLNAAQFERLYLTAFALNRGGGSTPKAGLTSELTPISTATSS